MFDSDCVKVTKVTKVKVGEKGKQAVFLNPDKQEFSVARIDGCTIVNKTACDYLVSRENLAGVLVELKGTDLPHALKQIELTLDYLRKTKIGFQRMAALIVCRAPSRHPSFTTKIQRIKDRLMTRYRMPLHIVTGNHEYTLEKILSFKKPL